MGCTQSAPTSLVETTHTPSKVTVVGVEKAAATNDGDATTAASTVVPLADPPSSPSKQPKQQHIADRFKKKLGYSSGGSSFISDESGHDEVESKMAAKKKTHVGRHPNGDNDDDDEAKVGRGKEYRRQSSSRHEALVHIRKDLRADGNLACGVVHIEVRVCVCARRKGADLLISPFVCHANDLFMAV